MGLVTIFLTFLVFFLSLQKIFLSYAKEISFVSRFPGSGFPLPLIGNIYDGFKILLATTKEQYLKSLRKSLLRKNSHWVAVHLKSMNRIFAFHPDVIAPILKSGEFTSKPQDYELITSGQESSLAVTKSKEEWKPLRRKIVPILTNFKYCIVP